MLLSTFHPDRAAPGPGHGVPVSVGEFDDGPDLMLWNPHLFRASRRREALRAMLSARVVLCGLSGIAFVVVGALREVGFDAVLTIVLGALALAGATLAAVVSLAWFEIDHVHKRGQRCRLERQPGEFFYRTRDFTDLGTTTSDTVSEVVEALHQLHVTPARVWLDPALPRHAHVVAWDALRCLDHTRAARALVHEPGTGDKLGQLTAAANGAITGIDRAVAEVAAHLHACIALTQAWTVKLRHAGIQARAQAALDTLPEGWAARIAAEAETLPQDVFAYVTAARDITGAGPFPWEKSYVENQQVS
ncbi:hypothetical protein [Amycolatopsis pigmentata]|uniref:Uncharacterized protein n=1 Tax=Amycolatopsis pigmentata TaxID=450801 RepID=A0ABW5FIS7_9PSEU